jgi:pheromone shutdown protein TraB
LELDEARLAALTQTGNRGNALAGGLSFLVMVLLEKFAGNLTGSAPGGEMLQAAEAAQRVGSSIQFIDLPISITISAIRKLSFSEKLKLGLDSLVSITMLPLAKLSFSRITEDMETQIGLFRRRYPELGRILIDQREEYMTRRIEDIMDSTAGRVIVIVGYGHMKSLARRLVSVKRRVGFSTTTSWIVST